jgi:hypothetical protein
MNVLFSKSVRLLCWILLGLLPTAAYAQNPAVAPSASPGHGSKPAPSVSQPHYTEEQMQEIISKVEDRIKAATDVVFGRIQKSESDIHLRFSYLRKPERLDPNTYASKGDIASWRNSLEQLTAAQNNLDKLYANADVDLGNALMQQRINPSIANQIKTELMTTFPWTTIRKKSELMRQFVGDHEELLNFYDKNWGTWKPGSEPGTATFSDASLTTAFQSLKDKINATGGQIDDQYKLIVQ